MTRSFVPLIQFHDSCTFALRMAGVQPYLRVGTSAMSHVDITNCHNFTTLWFKDFPYQHTRTITYLQYLWMSPACAHKPVLNLVKNGKQRIGESWPINRQILKHYIAIRLDLVGTSFGGWTLKQHAVYGDYDECKTSAQYSLARSCKKTLSPANCRRL